MVIEYRCSRYGHNSQVTSVAEPTYQQGSNPTGTIAKITDIRRYAATWNFIFSSYKIDNPMEDDIVEQ